MREGESVPNTQMALYVLPRAADLVEARAWLDDYVRFNTENLVRIAQEPPAFPRAAVTSTDC